MRKNKLVTFVLDLLFPSFCIGCGREGNFLCADCRGRIVVRRVPAPHAPRGVAAVYAACDYRESLVSELVKQLKYGGIRDLSEPCTGLIVSHLSLLNAPLPPDPLVVAVPLSARRLKERGFNQAELIARGAADALSLPFVKNALARIRHTEPQTEMTERKDRLTNIIGAVVCPDSELVLGRNILLVDDVMTTGATLSECAKALKNAGAKKVFALVVAA